MARISTHVLDTALGQPVAGILVELYQVTSERLLVKSAFTNQDGRTGEHLSLAASPGVYELVFHAGEYLRQHTAVTTEPSFLDRIAIRFGVAEAQGNYHVPLLLSPYGYSTYRGS